MSQQKNQQNLSPPTTLPQITSSSSNSQIQSGSVQSGQTPVSIGIRPTSVTVRGGAKKKMSGGGKKAGTGTRPKPITTEKNDDTMLAQSLSKIASDYHKQVQQFGQNTPEGQAAYKKYIDTMQALEQHQRNNQLGNIAFTPAVNKQISSPASTPSPHQIPRMISSTISTGPTTTTTATTSSSLSTTTSSSSLTSQPQPTPTPQSHHQTHSVQPPQTNQQQQQQQVRIVMPQEYNNIQTIQQLKSEIFRVTNLLQQDNLVPTLKADLMNRANILNQLSVKFNSTNSNTGIIQQQQQPPQHMSPQSPYNSPRGYLGPSSHMQDSSMITSPTIQQQQQQQHQQQHQQQMLHQQTIQLQQHHHPQSPNSQSPLSHQIQSLPPSSPRSQQQPPQSPLSHQIQSLPPLSPRSQPPSQPPQTQPPITTNSSGLPSPRLNLINLNKTPGVRTTLMPHLIQNVNTNLPETPVSLSLPESDDVDKQLLSKRKIQQLVDQIDPKERLEPEVEEMLLEIADEFISSVSSFACLLAKHRKSDTLEVKDLQLHLERNWNIRIPGFASDEIRSVKKAVVSSSHQQKLLAVNSAKANKVATTVTSTSQSSLGN